jgi:lipid-binding SYLF domain-containing protein
MRKSGWSGLLAAVGLCLGILGCAHTPTSPGARADLKDAAAKTLAQMEAKDSSLRPLLDQSVGYVVFPSVGSGGFIIGGGSGSGVLYENGAVTSFAEISQLSAGALAGGSTYSQVVVVRDRKALEDMKAGRFDFGAKASAVIVRTGAATGATFENGVAVFVEPIGGAMVNASIGGQKIRLSM